MRKNREKKLKVKKDKRWFLKLSLLNLGLFAFWDVAFTVCLILRAVAFNTAQANMAAAGYTVFTVEVSSPFFGVLSFIGKLLPVFMILWSVLYSLNVRKNKPLCNNKIIFAVLAVDVLSVLLMATDIIFMHLIFA